MTRLPIVIIRSLLGALTVSVLVIFLPIAFGLMPEKFFEYSCTVGESYGTSIVCFRFMWNTLTTGVFIGIIGPVIGMFLVHREMALIGETLAHTAFAGVAFGTLVLGVGGWDARLLLSALGVTVLGAIAVQLLSERTGTYGDVPVAIMLTGSFAVGTLFIDFGGGFAFVDINSYLFGSISITDDNSVTFMALLSIVVVGVIGLAYKPLFYITFDEESARAAHFPVDGYNATLILLTALVVVGSMQILGVILVAGMLVIPVAAASLLFQSFREALYASIVFGVLSVIAGIIGSWYLSLRPGATIIVISIFLYLFAVIVTDNSIAGLVRTP